MSQQKYLSYRGDVKAALGVGGTLLFVTAHPEKQPTALYRLDVDKAELAGDPLPCGGVALAVAGEDVYVGGTDGQVYRSALKGGTPKPLGDKLPAPAAALVAVAGDRLAVLVGRGVHLLSRKDGQETQKLELPEAGTVLAADPSGQWLAVGTTRGTVAVFECEDKPQFVPAEAARLHEGAVTALLFEREELRFLSAGADRKLLSTHARGKLEPEDKGRGNNHSEPVTGLVWGPADRFLTGSADKTVKSWPRVGFVKPATAKDGVGKVLGLTLVQVGKKTQLAVPCDDNSLRFFSLDDEGKVAELVLRVHDALAGAKHELTQDVGRREAALKTLAEYADGASLDLINQQMGQDQDHGLRLLAAELLGKSKHPRAAKLLEAALNHKDEKVRLAALDGLRGLLGRGELRPLDLALKTEKADIGVAAVRALAEVAKANDQALARLRLALDGKSPEVRTAALAALEAVFPADSPEPSLTALSSTHADLRRLALLRLFQRDLLRDARVEGALRWRGEDGDAEVRKAAFLLALHTRPALVKALRERDPELKRQLDELEKAAKETAGQKPAKGDTAAEKPNAPKKGKAAGPVQLDPADYEPLLQATASRALDTCLRGARGLAVLGDVRAFGLLLQLSREENPDARVQVCAAMGALEDARGVNRLRSLLFDPQPPVRDAAFSALLRLHDDAPLRAAEAGLGSAHEDVRRRALQVLTTAVKKKPPATAADPSWQLLVRALNDSFPAVRGEACKASLNLQVNGGGVQTLRFLLQSVHADVRREVLTEVMAQADEPWAWHLLQEFYDDADPRLREETFNFATQKDRELGPLERGLLSQYADVRRLATQALAKKHTPEAQQVLARVLGDSDKQIRQLALQALVADNAHAALLDALTSAHPDVRVRAAAALARQGHRGALNTLVTLATAPEPQQRERVADWQELAEQALTGLAELGHPGAVTDLLPLLQSKHQNVRGLAARALAWSSRPENVEPLRQALQHDDPRVKYLAALGLACAGDPLAASLVFSADAARHLSAGERLVAALTLGPAGEDQLVVFLDDPDDNVRRQALLLLMLLELKSHQGSPTRCLAALSSRMPRVRLTAAQALEAFADPDRLRAYVVKLVNDRGDEQAWTIPAQDVDTLAELVTHANPHLRARTALLLEHFTPKEQHAWNLAWAVHTRRYADELRALQEQAASRAEVPSVYTAAQLRELAFGAYVGLVREQGGAHEAGGRPALGPHVIRVRQAALNRLLALAKEAPPYAAAARPVFIQALADPNQAVRVQAFEQLQSLGLDRTALGAAAMEAGHLDLGVKGLELLSAGASSAEGQAALAQVLLNRTDALAVEAAKLLIPPKGKVAVAVQCLEAASQDARQQGVAWLVEEYDASDEAKRQLRQALQSRHPRVRNKAALELADKKDPAAFDVLVDILRHQEEAERQKRAVRALETLGDPRTPDALLDRLEDDPTGTAQADELLRAAGHFRRPATADRLLALAERDAKNRRGALNAVLTVSGYDQNIDDPEDEKADRTWLDRQHPRHDGVLARLMEQCFVLGETKLFNRLVPAARWAKGKEVEPVLTLLVNHPDESLRTTAVEALGWRLRKRGGTAEPLLKALQHRDPKTQFVAAEALARGGRKEGLNVLLAAIDFQSDFQLRRRAVLAIGELADQRCLDVLLKLADEEGHVLQESAAEALGHLGKSDHSEEIFKRLERLARGTTPLSAAALRGLRWFNSRAGWQVIRERAQESQYPHQAVATDLLGFNDDPATRDVLLQLLRECRNHALQRAGLSAARRLWGEEGIEPDLAILQNPLASSRGEPYVTALKRVTERADPRRLFDVLPRCKDDVQQQLVTSLLTRQPPPVAEARDALTGTDPRSVQVAAHLLGRAGADAGDCGPALRQALESWGTQWQQRRREMLRKARTRDEHLDRAGACLESLLWAAGRVGAAPEALAAAVTAHPDDPFYAPVRVRAVTALGSFAAAHPAALAVLRQAAVGNDPEVRTVAADALARLAPGDAADLAEQMLSDRTSFDRLARHEGVDVTPTLQKAAGQVHYQGVALPRLIARDDVTTLLAVADNRALPRAARLGAVEGLAALADEAAEAQLVAIGQSDQEDDEVRKAAWRGLRRSRRQRKHAVAVPAVPQGATAPEKST